MGGVSWGDISRANIGIELLGIGGGWEGAMLSFSFCWCVFQLVNCVLLPRSLLWLLK